MFSEKNKKHDVLRFKRFFNLTFSSVMIVAALMTFLPSKAQAASVVLSAAPTSRTVNQGQSTTYTINLGRDGYAGSVTLSASNLPANATASFSPNPTTGKSSVLTVTTKTTTPTGTFQIKLGGAGAGVGIAPINLTLVVKAAPSVTVTAVPATQSIIAWQAADYSIRLNRTNYDGPVTLSATLPNGLSAAFEPNPVYGSSSRMRIYTHLLPFTGRDYDIILNLRELDRSFGPFRLRVNCGLDWAEQFAVSSDPLTAGGDFARDVAVASDGSIYVAGDLVNQNAVPDDAWVAKFSASGVRQWLMPISTSAEDRATEIAVDANGDVFVGGYTKGTFPGNNQQGNKDFWIAKFDSQGTRLWIKQGGTLEDDGEGGFEIVPDGTGGGKFLTLIDEQSKVNTYTFSGSDGTYTQQNSFPIWWLEYEQADSYTINDLALGPDDTVYTVGRLNLFLGGSDGWIVKYNNLLGSNNRIWSQNTGFASAARVVVDSNPNGFLYVSGSSFDNGTDAWVARFRAAYPESGNRPVDFNPATWTEVESSPAEDRIGALALSTNGDLIVAGMTQGLLGEASGSGNSNNTRFDDAFVARRDSATGNLRWIRQFPVADIDGFDAVAIGSNNGLYLAGYTVAFKSNLGFEDALLLRYADNWTLFSPVINASGAFTPASGAVGSTITINGANFFGISVVRFNGVPTTFNVTSPNTIEAQVPLGATDGKVSVTKECDGVTSVEAFDVLP